MKYKYDVAVSYAGEQKDLVVPIVDELEKQNIKVFIDYEHPEKFWGKHIPSELRNVYYNESKIILMFLSKEYSVKKYTNFEAQIICEKAMEGNRFLVIRIDEDADLPWLNSSIGYKNYSDYSAYEFAKLIINILKKKDNQSINSLFESIKEWVNSYKKVEFIEKIAIREEANIVTFSANGLYFKAELNNDLFTPSIIMWLYNSSNNYDLLFPNGKIVQSKSDLILYNYGFDNRTYKTVVNFRNEIKPYLTKLFYDRIGN